jgi:excinuclease UvrABC helicase subunit UvrB
MVGRLAHSPRIYRATQIPHDQFDEWLVFERPTQVDEFETMVNRCYFTPIGIELQEEQERFWEQVVRLKPSHVMAQNHGVYLVSRDEDLIVKIMNSDVRGRSVVE